MHSQIDLQSHPAYPLVQQTISGQETLRWIEIPDPIHAIRSVTHGVTAKYPRFRYLSGTLAKTLFRVLWKMPEEWSFVIKKGTVTPLPKIVR